MGHPFSLPGFEAQDLSVEYFGWMGKARLWVNGSPAPEGEVANRFHLTRDDGSEVSAQVTFLRFGLAPVIYFEGSRYSLPSPLRWFHWPLMVLPLFLVGVGGMLGAVFGSIGFIINARILSGDRPGWLKIAATLAVSGLMALLFSLATIVVSKSIGG